MLNNQKLTLFRQVRENRGNTQVYLRNNSYAELAAHK